MKLKPALRVFTLTDEIIGLYDDMLLQIPEARSIPVLKLEICTTKKGKRLLCMTTHSPWSERDIGYAHYHPDGCTLSEIEEVQRRHGCTGHSINLTNPRNFLVAHANVRR